MVDKNNDMNSNNARAFIREVNDEIYEAKIVNFWSNNRLYVFLFVLAVIVGTASYEVFSYFKKQTILKEAKQFEDIIDLLSAKKEEEAVNALYNMTQNAKYGYKDMAFVNLYSHYISKNDPQNAVKVLDDMIENAYTKTYRQYAVMQKMYMLADGMSSAELKKNLQPLIDSNSGFKYEALYMLLVKYIDENSNRQEVEKIMKSLKDKDAEIPNFFKAGFARIDAYLTADKVVDNSKK